MTKRRVDSALISQMSAELKAQEAPASAFAKSDDTAFPVFSVPLEKQLIVYIPRTPIVTKTADGVEVENPCVSYQHAVRDGKSYTNIRCINGLHNDVLGYDGDCPLCNAVSEAYQVYSKKLAIRAAAMHIDISKDSSNPVLQPVKQELGGEMPVKRAEKFYTVPIVVLSEDPSKPINAADFKVYYWDVREQHLKDKLFKSLSAGLTTIGTATVEAPSMFGRFYVFDYRYDTKGATANKMLAAKNVQYTVLDGNQLNLTQFVPTMEQLAATFTVDKAVEVVKSNQLWYKEDLEQKTDDLMAASRAFLAQAEAVGVAPVAETAAIGGAQYTAAAQLEAFGGATAPTVPNVAMPAPTAMPAQGVAAIPTAQVAPMGSPNVATTPTPAPAPAVATAPVTPSIGAM